MERDFSETQVLCRLVVNYEEMVTKEHALLNRIENVTTEEERATLAGKSKKQKYTATLLPIKTVGVQGDSRSYSYAVGISSVSDPDWDDLLYFASARDQAFQVPKSSSTRDTVVKVTHCSICSN